MSRLVKIIALVCFLIVPSTAALLTEDDPDYFPAEFTCPDSGKRPDFGFILSSFSLFLKKNALNHSPFLQVKEMVAVVRCRT